MFPIVQRYIVLEILKSITITTLILFIIMMSNLLGGILSDISTGEVTLRALIPILIGESVHVLSLLLPLGFFLGVVFALGRLYKDHELIVLQACGYGYRPLFAAVVLIMIPVFMLTAWCSLWLSADMLQQAKKTVDKEKDIHEFQLLKVGQFNESSNKDHVFFMQSMSADKTEVSDLIISTRKSGTNIIETAKRGRQKVDPHSGDLFLEVGPGNRYEGIAGKADYQVTSFQRHGILLKKKQGAATALDSSEKYLSQILASDSKKDRMELHWRISIPVSLIVLGLLAVPLSYINPRQGRYGKIGFALLIFILYLNLLGFTRAWLEEGRIPMWLNFWWVHGLFLIFALSLLQRRTRIFFWPLRE